MRLYIFDWGSLRSRNVERSAPVSISVNRIASGKKLLCFYIACSPWSCETLKADKHWETALCKIWCFKTSWYKRFLRRTQLNKTYRDRSFRFLFSWISTIVRCNQLHCTRRHKKHDPYPIISPLEWYKRLNRDNLARATRKREADAGKEQGARSVRRPSAA